MIGAQRRATRIIQRLGEPFTVGGVAGVGVFTITLGGRLNALVGAGVADSLPRPVWSVVVPAGNTTAVGQTVTWRSADFQVIRAFDLRLGNVVITRFLLISPAPTVMSGG